MDLTAIFETIKNYPLESLGATLTTILTTVFSIKGVSELFSLVFNRTKKITNKVQSIIESGLSDTQKILADTIGGVKDSVITLKAEIDKIKDLIGGIDKNTTPAELVALIDAFKAVNPMLAEQYEKNLLNVQTSIAKVEQVVVEKTEEINQEIEKEIETVVEEVQKPLQRVVRVKRVKKVRK